MAPDSQAVIAAPARWGRRGGWRWSIAAAVALLLVLILHGAGRTQPDRALAQTRPNRIVSLVPAVTEMLFAIGAGPQVVGVSSFDHFPPEVERLPRVGALIDPDRERILSLRPDLVIVYGTQTELIAQFDRAGVPLFRYQHAGLPDVMETIRSLGARVGAGANAERLAGDLDRELDAVRRAVVDRKRPRTLLVFGKDGGTLRNVYASGGVGFLHDMLLAAGGEDMLEDLKQQSVQTSVETLLARAPEVIVELRYGATMSDLDRQREIESWNPLTSVPAVRNRRVVILAGDEFVVPGPRVAQATRRLAEALHPSQFPR